MVKTQKYVNNIKENSRLEKEIRQKEHSRGGKIANFQTSFNWLKINRHREREREREREQSQTSHGTGIVGKSKTTLPPSRLFKLNLQFFGSLTNDSQTTQPSERKERNFSKNTELVSREQSVFFSAFSKEKLIRIKATQLTLIEELGIGKEEEKCLINNCPNNNLFPSPLCLGHTAGALDYLENYEKQQRTKKWVKEQKKRRRLTDCATEIKQKLKKIWVVEAELETLKSDLNHHFPAGRKILFETHTQFLHLDKQKGITFIQNSQNHTIFRAENSWEKAQQFWKKLEFLTRTKSQLIILNSRYSQLQKELPQTQIEIPTFKH